MYECKCDVMCHDMLTKRLLLEIGGGLGNTLTLFLGFLGLAHHTRLLANRLELLLVELACGVCECLIKIPSKISK